jgi:hypothetical protein
MEKAANANSTSCAVPALLPLAARSVAALAAASGALIVRAMTNKLKPPAYRQFGELRLEDNVTAPLPYDALLHAITIALQFSSSQLDVTAVR